MSKRNALVILALSGILFAFSLGVLVARPAGAQGRWIANSLGVMFPHQSDLWCYRPEQEQLTLDTNSGNYFYVFTVQPDSHRGLPVLLRFSHATNANPSQLYRKENGEWVVYAETESGLTHEFSPGVLLQPGEYGLLVGHGDNNGNPPQGWSSVTLVGYWAQP